MSWSASAVGRRTKAMVRRRRAALLARLGGRCAVCGTKERLEFDHPLGRDYDPASLSGWRRIKRYEADARAGNLRVLCRYDNASRRSWEHHWLERRYGRRAA